MSDIPIFDVVWTKVAEESFGRITDYIAADNPQAAESWLAKIRERVGRLQESPGLGPRYLSEAVLEIRHLVIGRYRVFYEVQRDVRQERILIVWHGAQREPSRDDLGISRG